MGKTFASLTLSVLKVLKKLMLKEFIRETFGFRVKVAKHFSHSTFVVFGTYICIIYPGIDMSYAYT